MHLGDTNITKDIYSTNHKASCSGSQNDDGVSDEVRSVIVDDNGALVDKAGKSSICSHYNTYSRRRYVVSSQRVITSQHDRTADTTTSMYVCI